MNIVLVCLSKPNELLRTHLHDGVHHVFVCVWSSGRALTSPTPPDIVVLDAIRMSEGQCVSVVQSIRAQGVSVPLIVVTPHDASARLRVCLLNYGADDCISVHHMRGELIARLLLLSRRERTQRFHELTMRAGNVSLDIETHTVIRGTYHVPLTKFEYSILEYLFFRRPAIATQEEILSYVQDGSTKESDVLYTHIHNIRKKLAPSDIVKTVSGCGFLISE